jgi:multiple sugar transport system permease protein
MQTRGLPGLLLVLPALLLAVTLTIYPVGYGFWLSLHAKHSLFPQQTFVGLDNYLYLLHDPEFWESLRIGLIYSVSTIFLQLVLGVAAALLLHQSFFGRNIVRGLVLFPYMIPTVVAVILWKWMLNNQFGLINFGLVSLGISSEPINWFGRSYIMASLILVSVWQFFPSCCLRCWRGCRAFRPSFTTRRRVDGAGPVARFVFVTLPQLASVLFITILLRSIWMFHQVRHGMADDAGRRRRALHPHHAGLRLPADVQLL